MGASGQESTERLDRLVHDLRDIKKRWDNRLQLEQTSVGEAYIHGNAEIVVHGEWTSPVSNNAQWVCCISSVGDLADGDAIDDGVDPCDFNHRNGWDQQIMLVVIVEGVEAPKRLIRSVLRPYFFKKIPLSAGRGLLYQSQVTHGFEVLPYFSHRKMGLCPWVPRPNDSGAEVIQCAPEVMDGISDEECEGFRDWLRRRIAKSESRAKATICIPNVGNGLNRNSVKLSIEWACQSLKIIDVLVGPFNL